MKNHWLAKRQIKHFLRELSQYIAIHESNGEAGIVWKSSEPDFHALYAKYPRVRIGINRAIRQILDDYKRKICHV